MKKLFFHFDERLISKDNFKSFNRRTGRPFLSKEFKAFEERIAWSAKAQWHNPPLTEDLQVLIIAYFRDKRHSDTGNLSKSLCDSVNKILWVDDRQIKKLMVEVVENSPKEYFEMYVSTLTGGRK
jgi:Holliday junction resolvase RusA-like endonuclease